MTSDSRLGGSAITTQTIPIPVDTINNREAGAQPSKGNCRVELLVRFVGSDDCMQRGPAIKEAATDYFPDHRGRQSDGLKFLPLLILQLDAKQ